MLVIIWIHILLACVAYAIGFYLVSTVNSMIVITLYIGQVLIEHYFKIKKGYPDTLKKNASGQP